MMKPTRLAALWLALVFLAGAVFGYVGRMFYVQGPARAASSSNQVDTRQRFINGYQKDLGLTPDQVSQVTTILDDTHRQFQNLRDRMDPEFEALRESQRTRIMAILTPDQQQKYLKIIERRRQRDRDNKKNSGR